MENQKQKGISTILIIIIISIVVVLAGGIYIWINSTLQDSGFNFRDLISGKPGTITTPSLHEPGEEGGGIKIEKPSIERPEEKYEFAD